MRGWVYPVLCSVAGLAVALTLIGDMQHRNAERTRRLELLADAVMEITERMAIMSETGADQATTVVPCPKTGLDTTVCTTQNEGESNTDFATRHLARVQAFIDACRE